MIFKFFDKNLEDTGIKYMSNYQLANKVHKSIIKKFKRRKVYSSLKDHIWGAYLADVLLISKCNNRITYLLWAIDVFSKYAWVVSLKDKKAITDVDEFKTQTKQIQVDQGS